jgi:hypothetical protein
MSIRKRWAFLVGINRYTDYRSLNYCVDDVLALEKLLCESGYTVCCLHDRLDRETSDGRPNPRFPTKDNIRGELKRLCNSINQGPEQGQNDLLLVYFACHGNRQPDDIPRLMARDTQQSLVQEAITIAEIERCMAESGAGCRMLMLDACRIGMGTTDSGSRAPSDPDMLRKIHDAASGYALLAASSNHQDAKEWGGMKHGVFSYYVLSGLSGQADLHDKNYVTVNDLAGFVSLRIQEWAVEQRADQMPCQRIENNLGGFILIDNCQKLKNLELPEVSGGSTQPEVQNRGRSPAEVIECLWSLNYRPQDQTFENHIPPSRRAAAFVVQAKDSRIQHWLVKRLFKQIPFGANAKVFTFTVPTHPMKKNRDFNEIWPDLAGKLGCEPERTVVINALVEVYQTKPIILAMYGWSAQPLLQQLQQQVLNELWQPLVQAIGTLPIQPPKSRLILFLAEVGDRVADGQPAHGSEVDAAIPVPLSSLTAISSDHVIDWVGHSKVCPLLSQYVSEEKIEILIREEIPTWDTDPVATIEQICYIFELDNGIADIEAAWRLAG